MDTKMLLGIINAPIRKRYKNFVNTVVDTEEVWLLDGGNGYCTYDDGVKINIIVYPFKEFASYFSEGATPVAMEIHEFCNECKKMFGESDYFFAVSPNNENAIQVTPQQLYYDLMEALAEVE